MNPAPPVTPTPTTAPARGSRQDATHASPEPSAGRWPDASAASRPARPKVTAAVLSYNGWQDTVECLQSLKRVSYPLDILVIDNGSTDNSRERLQAACQEMANARLIENPTNEGIAGGNNLGIWHALADGADYVLLLSNDTTVEPDFLQHLVEVAESDPQVGLVSAKICYHGEPGRIWFAGARLHPWLAWAPFLAADELDDPQRHAGVWSADVLLGCIMLIRRRVIEDVGAFDSRYFFQNEDLEFCYRVRRSGWRVRVAMSSRIYHKIGRTIGTASPARWYYGVRNRLFFVKRRLPWWQRPSAYAAVVASLLVHSAIWARQGRGDLTRASLEGLVDFRHGRFGVRTF
ncbi:MAG TPA: glycosyltransferase family 2 protein [Actinomycetota bacterium]|nr:glycosyltransferase family 2 protein [Actinomycetota bacterium]